ncbi:hypothetical protein BSR28_00180 [Boudabousia liubingyangii]|nr:hypothetical protein [Boudabousia liubingyangii]OKL48170.1 hypothetical protein BSR28_00180 [Boudabousia liubingyangii]
MRKNRELHCQKTWHRLRERVRDERGNQIASHIMVQTLVLIVILALLQLAYSFHVRATVIDVTAQAARRGALLGATPAEVEARTRQLLAQSAGAHQDAQVEVKILPLTGAEQNPDQIADLLSVKVTTRLPVLVKFGPQSGLSFESHQIRLRPRPPVNPKAGG